MNHSISHGNYDDRAVQGIPVCPNHSHVIAGIPVTSQGTTTAFSVGGQENPSKVLSPKEERIVLIIVTFLFFAFMVAVGITSSKSNKDPVFCVESASVSVSNDSVGNLTMARWNVGFLAKNPEKHTRMFSGVNVELSLSNFDYVVRAKSGAFELRGMVEMLLNATGRVPLLVLHETRELHADVNLLVQVGDKNKFQAICKDRRFEFSSDGIFSGAMVSNSTQCCSKRCSDLN